MSDPKPMSAGWPAKLHWTCAAILAIGLATAGAIWSLARSEWGVARAQYIEASRVEMTTSAARVESGLNAIYTNIRTLAALPSVRKIERHGENLSADSRQTFQQIYNNLVNPATQAITAAERLMVKRLSKLKMMGRELRARCCRGFSNRCIRPRASALTLACRSPRVWPNSMAVQFR